MEAETIHFSRVRGEGAVSHLVTPEHARMVHAGVPGGLICPRKKGGPVDILPDGVSSGLAIRRDRSRHGPDAPRQFLELFGNLTQRTLRKSHREH